MSTIAEENKKILRQALDVSVGIDIPLVNISRISVSNAYWTDNTFNTSQPTPVLMDLSGDGSGNGFLNDGRAVPLGGQIDGAVMKLNEPITFSITLAESTHEDIVLIGYQNGSVNKWTVSGTGSTRTVTIAPQTPRAIFTRVVCGQAFWLDNSNLISCTLQLRSVDTKPDNPELQMSEIEIQGYESNDITDALGEIGTGFPIYYSSGYADDMSPVRTFYLSDSIEFESNIVTIRGTDATYLLDGDFEGELVYGSDAQSSEIGVYNLLDKLLTNSNIPHYKETISRSFGEGLNQLLQPSSKREVVATIVNMFNYGTVKPVFISYVDAGIPRLTCTPSETVHDLTNIGKPKITAEPLIHSISVNAYYPFDIAAYPVVEIEQVEMGSQTNSAFVETSKPFAPGSFSVSSGTLDVISPYKVKITGSGTITLSGRPLYITSYYSLPEVYMGHDHGIDIDMGTWYLSTMDLIAFRLMWRSNIVYEFEYRGDPKLQPRDYIQADIDGSGVMTKMTIDSIELRHEGGGTSSTIVARKGFI